MQYWQLLNDINKWSIVGEPLAIWPYEPYIRLGKRKNSPWNHLPPPFLLIQWIYLLKHWGQHCPSLNVGWSHFTGGQSIFLQSTVPFWNKQSRSLLHMSYYMNKIYIEIQFNLIIAVSYKLVKSLKHSKFFLNKSSYTQ